MAADSYTAHDLMREVLEMTTQRWIDPARISHMANCLGLHDIPTRIFFITQLRERIRQLPLKLYPSPDIREKMLDAMQQALDNEIGREEGS